MSHSPPVLNTALYKYYGLVVSYIYLPLLQNYLLIGYEPQADSLNTYYYH